MRFRTYAATARPPVLILTVSNSSSLSIHHGFERRPVDETRFASRPVGERRLVATCFRKRQYRSDTGEANAVSRLSIPADLVNRVVRSREFQTAQ